MEDSAKKATLDHLGPINISDALMHAFNLAPEIHDCIIILIDEAALHSSIRPAADRMMISDELAYYNAPRAVQSSTNRGNSYSYIAHILHVYTAW